MKKIDYEQIKQEIFFEKYKYVRLDEYETEMNKILKRIILDLDLNKLKFSEFNTNIQKNRIFSVIKSYNSEIEELGVNTKNSILEELLILNKTFLKTEEKIFNLKLNYDNFDSLFNKDNYEFLDYNFNDMFKINGDSVVNKLKDDLKYALINDKDFNKFNLDYIDKQSTLSTGRLKTAVRTFYKKIREDTRVRVEQVAGLDNLIGWRSISVLDGKTSPICIYLSNQFYSIKDYKNRSKIENLPPRHFNCRSILIRVFKDMFEVNKRGAVGDLGGYQIDNRITFNSFLEQNPATTKKLLGAKRYELWKTGRYNINSFLDIDNNKFFSVSEILEEF